MKFKLFGRLRGDDNSSNTDTSSSSSSEPSFDSSPGGLGGSGPGGMEGSGPPTMNTGLENTVEKMFNQGYSEEEIRQELQGQYSEREIQDAVSQIVKTQASGGSNGPEPMSAFDGGNDPAPKQPAEGENMNQGMQNNPMPAKPQNSPQPQPEPISQGPEDGQKKTPEPGVEELVETIVAENFQKVEEEFENTYSEIDELKERMDELEDRVHDLEVRDDEDQTEFIQKMDEIEQDIDSYQSRIGGLEKAFQQVLPSLVDNVRELTSLVQEIKQEKGIETETTVSEDDIDSMDEW